MIVELNDLISLCGMAPRLSATRFMREDFQDHHSWLLREVFRLLPREGPPPQDEGNRERNKDLRYYEMIEKVSKNAGGWFGGLTGMLFASRTDVPVDEDVVVGALSGNSPNVTMVLSSDGGAGDSGRSVLSEHKEALESARACWRRWIRISDVTLKKSMAQTAACWFENALAVMTGGNVLRYTLADADDESDTIVLALTNLLEAPTIRWASARSSLNSSQHRFNMRRDYAPILTWISTDMQHARILRPDSYLLDCLELAVAVRSSLVRVSQLLVLVEQRVWTALPYMNQLYQTFETQVTQSHSLGCQPNSVSASSAPPRPGTKLQVFPPATFVAHLLQVISELLRSPELLGASVPSSLASSALVAYEHEPPLDSALAADGQAPPLSGHAPPLSGQAPPLSGQAPPMGTPAQTLKPQDLVPLCDTESTVCDPGVRTLSSKDVAARLTCLMFAVCSLSQEALSCGVTFALDDLVALIETPSFWSVDFADLGFDRRAGPVPAVPIIVMLYVHRMSPMAVNKALSAVRDDAVSRAVVEVTARANCALLQAFQAHAFVELLGQLLNHPQIVPPDPAEAAILEEDPGSVGGNAGDEGNRVPDETGIAYSGATTDPQARSSTVAETGAKSSSPEGSELDEAVAKQPQSGESRGGPQKRAGKTARRWLSVHRRKGQTEGVTPRMSVITNVTWPAVFVRLYVQCYMYATWRMWPLFCERLPNPPTSLFEPEEHAASLSGGDMRRGNVTGGSGLGGSSGGGGTDVFEEGTLLVPRLVKETYGRIAKMGVRIDGLMELWRSIAQLLSVMTAFGTRKERRVAMQAMSSHLGLVPCRGLESWYEIIELQLIPELSLNYVEVYPCCSYPIPLRKLGPPEPRNIPEVLGKTLLQLVSCHYEPIPIPFSSYLADLFVKAREYLVKNKLLGPRNNQVIGDLKRHILNVMEELNEPLQSIRLVDFTPPTKAVPSKAAKESAGKDGESAVNEAISEQNPERDPERVVHGLIPVVCRLLRICLHEIAVQERADANPEAILETLKTLLVVLASTPDIAKVDEVEGAVILKSLRQLPDGALVPKGQHRNAAKNPEDLSALDPRIRPTFECIQYILLLADMRTTIKSILEIIH
ncbi:hypothetical protein GNI_027900 [Gregarina niphandrodes]|uniref:Uncharacterized protein n=1 Tax=Gregarina niphandrodes TaxID=110365 RepID=A0A023BBD7_GRENI|nr:hypothetical protein GNI_027900 [Gregarina niphandrodes]EZG79248.1 hypothetical protein GNI_027900 [Gregarina niphandrodes]|eukprot:XP_011129095.1 hypothetical protein GNI_027900 [Gregarina niphandrodes]